MVSPNQPTTTQNSSSQPPSYIPPSPPQNPTEQKTEGVGATRLNQSATLRRTKGIQLKESL